MFTKKHWRIALLFSSVSIFLFGVLLRLFQVQILSHREYQAQAETQHGISYSISAPRGEIYSRDEFPLVANQPSYLLYGEPEKIFVSSVDGEETAKAVLNEVSFEDCPVINTDPAPPGYDSYQKTKYCREALVERLQFDRQWVPLIRNLSAEEQNKVESLGLHGLGFEVTPVRYYPEQELAAHVLGFVGADELGNPKGYFGLEGYYDGDLRGSDGLVLEERSALGEPILVGDFLKRPPRKGRDLVLTLDRAVQFMLEQELEEGVKRYGAESGTVIVMNPHTGEVISMANFPRYDPANPGEDNLEKESKEENSEEKDIETGEEDKDESEENESEKEEEKIRYESQQRNVAIASSYEPGSVIKALTMAAAIEEGEVTPQTTFVSKPMTVGNHIIRTWDNKYYGESTMIEVLERSDNTGAAWVALEKLGKRTLREYFSRFGLGEKTGIDLEGEAAGTLKPLSQWYPVDLANASFGQGLSATPLQVTAAFSVFANDGVLMSPYLVREIRDNGKSITFSPQKERRVLSKHTTKIMEGMLTKAAEHGEASFFVLEDWHVAGKTGTAQIPVGGKYDPHKTNTTFVGFLPESKKFVMLVKLEKTSTSIYAAETAVPLWMEMAKELIRYYAIPPDK